MGIQMNLQGEEAWQGGGGLPPGRYTVRVVEASEGISSGGHSEVRLTLEAVEGPHAGGSIRDWLVVTPNSLGKIKAMLEAFRFTIPPGDFELDAPQLTGAVCSIRVIEGTKPNGEPKLEVAAYNFADTSQQGSDVPADTAGLPQSRPTARDGVAAAPSGSQRRDPTIPF